MIKQSPVYYRPTNDEIDSLWENGLIIVDTNVLLDLYRISKTTSDEFLRTLKEYSKHLWIPNQVEFEFYKNRNDVIIEQQEKYSSLVSFLTKSESTVSNELTKYSRHPFIEIKKIQEPLQKTFLEVKCQLENLEQKHPDLILEDPILDELTRLYKGKTGEEYSDTRLQEIYTEGEERYRLKIPPGYRDQDKAKNPDNDPFGDLILWYQIIDKAKSSKKPIMLVTSEKKADWWHKIKGQKIGPKPELIQEIRNKAGVLFHMYSSDRFVLNAQERLKQTVNKDTLTELREIRNQYEIAEVRRDEEVRIETDRDSFVIGRSVEVLGYSYTNEDFVRLVLFGPGQFSEGIEIATPEVSDSKRWKFTWDPGYSIQAGLYTFVVFDPQKRISAEVSVRAEKGSVTVVAHGDQSYYIGEKIKLSGTSTASRSVFLAIRGANAILHGRKLDDIPVISENSNPATFVEVNIRNDCTWSYIWDTSIVGKYLQSGTYTIFAIEGPFSPTNIEDKAYGSVSIIIKKPFVSCTVSQSIIAQGDRLILSGTAEGVSRQQIQIWIFGNSFSHQEIIHTNSDSSFSYILSSLQTRQFTPGQYFVIVQHPMMNNIFDVYIDDSKKNVYSNYSEPSTPIFSLEGPGSVKGMDAAVAVVNAINNSNIDDTYTKCMFLVESPYLNLLPITPKNTGDIFTISGSTNFAIDSEILVEVYSSSFDPTQKHQAGKFSGATGTIKVRKGGVDYNQFSFDVDSSPFIPDEYIVTAIAVTSNLSSSIHFIIRKSTFISQLIKRIFRLFKWR